MSPRCQLKLVSLALMVISCSTPKGPEFYPAEVVERIGGKDETPGWSHGEKATEDEKGNVVFIENLVISGDSRPEECVKVASIRAASEILGRINDAITESGQVNTAGLGGDPGYESLVAYLRKGKLSGVSIQDRYWEKRVESDASGQRVLRVACAAKVAIRKSDLERQIVAAMGGGGNPEIRKQLLDAQKKFFEEISNEGTPAEEVN